MSLLCMSMSEGRLATDAFLGVTYRLVRQGVFRNFSGWVKGSVLSSFSCFASRIAGDPHCSACIIIRGAKEGGGTATADSVV